MLISSFSAKMDKYVLMLVKATITVFLTTRGQMNPTTRCLKLSFVIMVIWLFFSNCLPFCTFNRSGLYYLIIIRVIFCPYNECKSNFSANRLFPVCGTNFSSGSSLFFTSVRAFSFLCCSQFVAPQMQRFHQYLYPLTL